MHVTRRKALSLVAATAAASLAPGTARAQAVTVRIGQNANDAFGEGYYGADGGTFAAAGLNVEITTFPNGAAQAAACAGSAIDVGLGEATELANATRDWLTANAATARRLTAAIYDTARWANAHRDLSAPILAKYSKLDMDRIHAMNRARFATSLDPRLIQPVLDLAFTYGGLPRHFDAAELIARGTAG